jgi:hypothetical protein
VEEQLKRKELDQELRSYFHFAAGKILDDIGQYRDAFAHYTQSNTLANRKFYSSQFRSLVKDILYVSGPSQARRAEGSGNSSETPTFIHRRDAEVRYHVGGADTGEPFESIWGG